MAHIVDSPMQGLEPTNSTGMYYPQHLNLDLALLYITFKKTGFTLSLKLLDIEMKEANMEDSKDTVNGNSGDSNLDFCTADDFLSVSHSTALVSPSGAEFDLIEKVKQNIKLFHYKCIFGRVLNS